MGALIKKTEARFGMHRFEVSEPSFPFRTVNQAAESPATLRCCRHNQASWPECLFMARSVIFQVAALFRSWHRSASEGTCATPSLSTD